MIDRKLLPRLVIIYIFSMVIATVFDYEISSRIANTEAAWASALEIIGEPPALIFTAFNFALICSYCFKKRRYIIFFLSALGAVIASVYAFATTFNYLFGSWKITIGAPVGTLTAILLIWLLMRKDENFTDKYIRTAVTCVGAALTVLIVISFMKQLWGRVRYRQLLADATLSFTEWYKINGFGHPKFVSFPSGHTSNACVIFMIQLYFPDKRKILTPLLFMYIALMGVSRIAVGAHYLSDVLTGAAISLAICEIWTYKMKTEIKINDI